jgi:Flp pilus assembly protein TadG
MPGLTTLHPRGTRRATARAGGSMLELMLVLPMLLMFAFGVIDYGYYFYVRNTFQAAAAAGARAAVTASPTNTTVNNLITNMMSGAGLANSGYTVTFNPSDVSTATTGSAVTVTISTTWGAAGTHMLGTTWGGISTTKSVSASAAMMK